LNPEELLRLFQNARVYHVDDYPLPGTDPDHLDFSKIHRYFKEIYEIDMNEMSEAEQKKLLTNACILSSIQDKTCATVTGLVFFSTMGQPLSPLERFFPQAGIQFVAYEDEEMDAILDRLTVYRTCPEAIDDVVQKIRLNWKRPSHISGLKREEAPFPAEVFRELIVNAVVHRDYSISSRIQVRMFPDRVEVVTPGRLVNTVTIERMKAGISVLRNPLLVKFMQNYRYADQLGRGIPMILRRIEKMGGFVLELIAVEEQFWAVLRKKP
jgi:ATP-dependent DNA helicase RecG